MSKKILLLVTGMTPQIITETVYGLAHPTDGTSPWVPDEIHVISTQDGLNQIRDRLFEKGNFQRLIEDHQLPQIAFDESHLSCITNADGILLKDLKTPADNEFAADKICEKVREFTADDTNTLHVSIAGGRKTMGFYAGYALSLYGRAQDRMSHVLVDDRFETVADFYYPTPDTRFVTNREGKTLDAKDAQVWLANIPFVRLRESLPKTSLLNDGTTSFSQVVNSINLANRPQVILNTTDRTIRVGDFSCELPARDFAFYWWFASQHRQGMSQIIAPRKSIVACATTKEDCPEMVTLAEDYLTYYARLKGEMGGDSVQQTLRYGMERAFFDERISNIKKKFKQAFGVDVTVKIEIANLNRVTGNIINTSKAPIGAYGLSMDVDQIVIQSGL